jgi:hypothetical protein
VPSATSSSRASTPPGSANVIRWLPIVALVAVVLSGCAAPSTLTPERDSIAYRDDQDLQRVWLAEGTTFQSYNALFVGEIQTNVVNVNPDGVDNLAWARGLLRDQIDTALRAKSLFATVAVNEADLKPGTRILRLGSTIVEYEKGGGGARFFAGLYGAGQPVIRVRGRVTDGDRLVFAFEARRSGDSGLARVFGGYRSDKVIQEEDIRDLAQDLADYMLRNGRPR